MKKYSIQIEQDEQWWYVWEIVWLPACYTQAKTIPKLMERLLEVAKWAIVIQKWSLFDLSKLSLSLRLDHA